jgi:hypothetical protein
MGNVAVIDWEKKSWRGDLPRVNEGEGMTELWDVTLMERWMMASRGDEICQTVGGVGTQDQ